MPWHPAALLVVSTAYLEPRPAGAETVQEWAARTRRIQRAAAAGDGEVCRCRTWQGSPLLAATKAAWEDHRLQKRRSDPSFPSALLGASPEERVNHCLLLMEDMASPGARQDAFAAFALRRFGDEGGGGLPGAPERYPFCAPLMAAVAVLCGIDLYLDAVAMQKKAAMAFDTIKFADIAMTLATQLSFRCSHGASPLALFTRIEARWNFQDWMARFRIREIKPFIWEHPGPAHHQLLLQRACPPDLDEPLPAAAAGPAVECLVPAAWPEERELMVEIAESWAQDCDLCAFYVAVRPGVEAAPGAIGRCAVVDIADGPLVDEPQGYLANGAKLQTVLFHGIRHQTKDWACFADADVHFAVPNFRRMALRHRLGADAVHWVGFTFASALLQEGLSVEPFAASCVSRGAARQFVQRFPGWPSEEPLPKPAWPPTLHACKRMPVPHVPGYTMPTATACLGAAGVYATEPAVTHDARGRLLYFNFHSLREGLLEDRTLRPPPVPFEVDDHQQANITRYLWKGKEYIYGMCHNARWVGYYPVMFHGHSTHAEGYLAAFKGSYREQKKRMMQALPSQREVYSVLSSHGWRVPDDLRAAFARARAG